jgi:PAS domain S-box-containing protein
VEESPFGVSLIGEEGEFRYVNPEFVSMFGYALEDLKKKPGE